jgi:hypothetical protein
MRTRVFFIMLLILTAAACVIDEFWVDELVIDLDEPIDRAVVYSDRGLNGNVSGILLCAPQGPGYEQATLEGSGRHVLEITTEDDFERTALTIVAWEDSDGDGLPGCEELGTRFGLSLVNTTEVTVDDLDLVVGGAADEDCDPAA